MNQSGIVTPGGAPAGGAAPAMNINPTELEDVKCDKCENFTFVQVALMKRLPSVISPTGKETFMPMNVFSCAVCNHINETFILGMGGWFKGQGTGEDTQLRDLDESIEGSSLPGMEDVPEEASTEEE